MLSNDNNQSSYYFIQAKECTTAKECPVKGTIPSWVNGRLLRNGPGEHQVGKETFNHWFDGHALLHSFKLQDGKVFYKSKFIRSDVYNRHKKYDRIIFGGFGNASFPDPCKTIFQKFFSYFLPPEAHDNCCVNVRAIGDSYYALTDASVMRKFDPENLETKEKVDFNKLLAVHTATAHPHTDMDGTVYNIGLQFGVSPSYCIVKVPKEESFAENSLQCSSILAKVPAARALRPSYHHSFGMTENYIIIAETSLRFHVTDLFAQNLRKKTVMDALKFELEEPVKFHIVNKSSGKRLDVQFISDPFFAFHNINAYEEDDHIVMDLVANEQTNSLFEILLFKNLKNEGKQFDKIMEGLKEHPSLPCRYVMPLNTENETTGKNLVTLRDSEATAVKQANGFVHLTPEVLVEQNMLQEFQCGIELPAINRKYNTKKYRYCYFVTQTFPEINLVKLDVETKAYKTWKQEGVYSSEPVFIPSPTMTSEDDGIILSVILTRNPSIPAYLLVLDAKTFTEIARAEMNVQIPPGIHHCYAPQAF